MDVEVRKQQYVLNEAIKCILMAEVKSAKPSKHLEYEEPRWNIANSRKQGPLWTVSPTTDRAWCPLSWLAHVRLFCCFSWILLDCGSSHSLSMLSVFWVFWYFLWFTRPLNLHSTHIHWLTNWKSAKTFKTSETKNNSKNKDVKHTIKHINPPKMTPKYSWKPMQIWYPSPSHTCTFGYLAQALEKTNKGRCI